MAQVSERLQTGADAVLEASAEVNDSESGIAGSRDNQLYHLRRSVRLLSQCVQRLMEELIERGEKE